MHTNGVFTKYTNVGAFDNMPALFSFNSPSIIHFIVIFKILHIISLVQFRTGQETPSLLHLTISLYLFNKHTDIHPLERLNAKWVEFFRLNAIVWLNRSSSASATTSMNKNSLVKYGHSFKKIRPTCPSDKYLPNSPTHLYNKEAGGQISFFLSIPGWARLFDWGTLRKGNLEIWFRFFASLITYGLRFGYDVVYP